ncbi:ribonuclease domain-containing protein [Streptomyces sp. NPDC127112]|uniref:ribonuclease domain-containing protein n=1 Tax=Streptomyces sp. NPDC127112 TaxID=3345364 RepID=UPI0036394B41
MAQPIAWRTAVAAAVAAAVVSGTLTAASAHTPAPLPNAEQAGSRANLANTVHAEVPGRARRTLELIDAGQWPPNDGSGTRGGTTWPNRDGALPRTDAEGNPVQYQEWDVNRKQPGQARDPERIVTGSNGTAWYSADLFRTFEQMR